MSIFVLSLRRCDASIVFAFVLVEAILRSAIPSLADYLRKLTSYSCITTAGYDREGSRVSRQVGGRSALRTSETITKGHST